MALLELKDIGKIYATSGNIAVGIRGVDLSFERGEFVAVTGASGSGKSTLLNVISGMDTYEEGELFIEGSPTSHYVQSDWEEYRKKYISFIFQDYNIIESFTVLQNVELALMHIADRKQRRARAIELLNRVGLGDRLKQRGSKLSGGQKQRTVIARALAKDSPIILADEPTGNLDSKTSNEIIELLREVSVNKLLIVVTHSFDSVAHYATRHIRIFDGAVESDGKTENGGSAPETETAVPHENSMQTTAAAQPQAAAEVQPELASQAAPEISSESVSEAAPDVSSEAETEVRSDPSPAKAETKGERRRREIGARLRNGGTLGWTIFRSTPKLTVFICFLLILGTLAVFAVTSLCGQGFSLFDKYTMFTHIDGRVVVTKRDGSPMTETEAAALETNYGASDHLACDLLLDLQSYVDYTNEDGWLSGVMIKFSMTRTVEGPIVGRLPQAANEVLLKLPIYCQPYFGKNSINIPRVDINNFLFDVVGIKYYYDNTKTAEAVLSDSGFVMLTDYYTVTRSAQNVVYITGPDETQRGTNVIPFVGLEGNSVYYNNRKVVDDILSGAQYTAEILVSYSVYDYETNSQRMASVRYSVAAEDFVTEAPRDLPSEYEALYVGTDVLHALASAVREDSYRQTSLFFVNDAAARSAAAKMTEDGYIAVTSDTTYEPEAYETILNTLGSFFMLVVWVGVVFFISLFLSVCTRRAMDAFKSDMAIMRSMGIDVATVKVGVYVRMFISLLPSFVFMLGAALTVFLVPKLNGVFTFLSALQYVVIVFGMILMTALVTHFQIRRLFKESVKKSLKGDDVK